MKKHWSVTLICVGACLLPLLTQASPVSLGIVNGEVTNGALMIERSLSNPVLLSVAQDELALPLRALFIRQATLIKNQNGEITVKLSEPVNGGTIETLLTVEVWLDGEKTDVFGKTQGHHVESEINTSFQLLEVRASQSLQIQLPVNYRGAFDFSVEIEAQA